MKLSPALYRHLRWVHVPTGLLITFLQRTPVVRVAQLADEAVTDSPISAILKSAVVATAALGGLNTLAGATTLSTNVASPLNGTVNTAIQPVAFSILGTVSPPGSWQLTGSLPPGLVLNDNPSSPTQTLSGGVINTSTPILSGTPTAAGTYTITLNAWENSGASGAESPQYTYSVIISSSAGAPSFSRVPQSVSGPAGTAITLTSAASGSATYQWQKNGGNISGATSANYTISSPATTDSGTYDVAATNGSGSTTSSNAVVTVYAANAAPVFTAQPLSETVSQGVGVTFEATAVGPGTISYQWYKGSSQISGQTSSSLALINVQMGDQASYDVVATNANGSTTSSVVTLVVNIPAGPVITTQPVSLAVVGGASVNFSVVASGAIDYQWYFNGAKLASQTNATLTLSNVTSANAGTYYVLVDNYMTSTDSYGDMTTTGAAVSSNNAALTVSSAAAPSFTTQPASQSVSSGATVTFTAAASNSPSYQWEFNGIPITGQTSATLTLNNVTPANSGNYSALASNSGGTVSSTAAALNVTATSTPPTITLQPVGQTMASGSTVVFTAAASGATSYQWNLNSSPISGQTNPTLVVSNATSANAGSYTLTATGTGSTTSNAATLVITTTTNPGRLVNLSMISTITGSLSMGFVTGGAGTSGTETLLVRAVGPTLGAAPFNYPAIMPDPTLTITQQSNHATIGQDAGWDTPASNGTLVTAADNATGAFALSNTASLDSALVETLPVSAGGYSAVVAGKSGDSGNALTEVYDATTNYTLTTPRLVNLSCLTTIPSGGSIGVGFVIGGTTSKTVLVRAGGPVLGSLFGIGGSMPDPLLQVTPLSSGTTILASNAGWAGATALVNAAATVGAFAYPSATSADSVVLLTLAPGGYTAHVSGVSGDGGGIIVEVYEVP